MSTQQLPAGMLSPSVHDLVHGHFPRADAVFLMGDFNNWSTSSTPMVHLGEGIWSLPMASIGMLTRFCFFVWEKGDRYGRVVRTDA